MVTKNEMKPPRKGKTARGRAPIPSPWDNLSPQEFDSAVINQFVMPPTGQPIVDLRFAFSAFFLARLIAWDVHLTGEKRVAERHPQLLRFLAALFTHLDGIIQQRSLRACPAIHGATDATLLHAAICKCLATPMELHLGRAGFFRDLWRLQNIDARVTAAEAIRVPEISRARLSIDAQIGSLARQMLGGTSSLERRKAFRAIMNTATPGVKTLTLLAQGHHARAQAAAELKQQEVNRTMSHVQASEILKCAPRTVSRMLKDGRLKPSPDGLVSVREFEEKKHTLLRRRARIAKPKPTRLSADTTPTKAT